MDCFAANKSYLSDGMDFSRNCNENLSTIASEYKQKVEMISFYRIAMTCRSVTLHGHLGHQKPIYGAYLIKR